MSKSETQTELFAAFRELAETIQEMRAGQLMAAVGELYADLHGRGLWEASDAELIEPCGNFAAISRLQPPHRPGKKSDGFLHIATS